MFPLQFPWKRVENVGFQQSHMSHNTLDKIRLIGPMIIWKIADKANMNVKLVESTFSKEHLQASRWACLKRLEGTSGADC